MGSPGLCATVMITQCALAWMVAFVVQSEAAFLMTGTIPAYAPSKLHISAAAQDEIDNLQCYVGLPFITLLLPLGPHKLPANLQGVRVSACFHMSFRSKAPPSKIPPSTDPSI